MLKNHGDLAAQTAQEINLCSIKGSFKPVEFWVRIGIFKGKSGVFEAKYLVKLSKIRRADKIVIKQEHWKREKRENVGKMPVSH